MHEFDLAGNLERATEGEPHITQRYRHGVAIDHHQTALGIHQQSGAVIVAFTDAGDGKGHVEGDMNQRRRKPCHQLVAHHGQRGAAAGDRTRRRTGLDLLAGPQALGVVAMTGARREPAPVHAH